MDEWFSSEDKGGPLMQNTIEYGPAYAKVAMA